MDYITMKEMEFFGHTGCLPDEKENGQVFIVTVKMGLERIGGCKTDELDQTVDYSRVYETVKDEVTSSSCNLIEYLADRIANGVLSTEQMVDIVTVTVSKPHPPIVGIYKAMEVTVTRSRDDSND